MILKLINDKVSAAAKYFDGIYKCVDAFNRAWGQITIQFRKPAEYDFLFTVEF